MRRVPFQKMYRAFPELDAFPDSECERFVTSAFAQANKTISGASVLAGMLTGVACIILMIAMSLWVWPEVSEVLKNRIAPNTVDAVALILTIVFGVGLVSLAAGLTRDHFLLRAILDRIKLARCTRCKFSLLGLPVDDGWTRCPECGEEIRLADIGLNESDLLTPQERTAMTGAGGEGTVSNAEG